MATTLIQVRRGTEAEWSAANPVLAAGEYGYTTDTAKVKIGSGSAQWSALPYVAMDVSLFATQASLDATDAAVALKATQVSLDATDALVALNATQASLDATDAAVALKAPIDDPTFTTGITTPKIDIQSNGTIQGKDVVGNDTLKLRTIGNSDLSIEPAGTGIVQISTDVNLASGKEFTVDGVAIGGGAVTSVAGRTGAVTLGRPDVAISVNAQTGTTYTILPADLGKLITFDNMSPINVTVNHTLGVGFTCDILQIGGGQVQLSGSGTNLYAGTGGGDYNTSGANSLITVTCPSATSAFFVTGMIGP